MIIKPKFNNEPIPIVLGNVLRPLNLPHLLFFWNIKNVKRCDSNIKNNLLTKAK